MEKCVNETLNTNSVMKLDIPNIKRNYQISFYCRIIEMGAISIGHGFEQPWASAYVEIDETKICVYSYFQEKELQQVFRHKLEIRDFISVTIRVNDDLTADLFVTTSTGNFTKTIVWQGGFGSIKANVYAGQYADSKLEFYSKEYKKSIWAFGDSYFDMWPLHLNSKGTSDFLVDSFSGRQSLDALKSLKKSLKYGEPKEILWCMGMNDKDSDTQINSDWLNVIEEVIQICQIYEIKLILTTIPNCPEINHKFKNEYVKKSGFDYVDINQAVGADIDKNWYSGLLSKDNVHPTYLGAEIIAARMIADVPQLLK